LKKQLLISNDFVNSIIKNNNNITIKLLFMLVYENNVVRDGKLSTLTMDIKNIKKNLDLDFHNLRRNVKQIQKTIITIKNKKNITDLNLITKCFYDYDNQLIKIDVYNEILEELQELKNKYTIINLDNLFKLNNKHSIKFIQILENINSYDKFIPKTREFTNKELNELFNTNYKGFREIERAIIKPVLSELDELSNLTFIYDVVYDLDVNRSGRKPITGIKIYLKENKVRQLKMF
jgi:hypothetical protein